MNRDILLITEADCDSASYVETIEAAGDRVRTCLEFSNIAGTETVDYEPDLIIAEMKNQTMNKLGFLVELFKRFEIPIIVFNPSSTQAAVELAVKSGICVYISDQFQHRRYEQIVELALTRFQYNQSLQSELKQTRQQLEERKLVERAKGVLMREKRMPEDQAYRLMQRSAMENNLTLSQVANNILTVANTLKQAD